MKIIILSSSNPYINAGIVAKDILDGLRKVKGNYVKLVVKEYDKYPDKDIICIDSYFHSLISNYKSYFLNPIDSFFHKIIKKIFRLINKKILKWNNMQIHKNPDYHVQQINQRASKYNMSKLLKKINFNPDVIFIVFPTSFITAKDIYDLSVVTKARVFWQLASMEPFTGLCHYSWNCTRYINSCGECPAIYSKSKGDISFLNMKYKIDYMQKTDIELCIGSDWLIERAKQSSVFKDKKINKIFLSVNDKEFKPINKIKRNVILDNYKIPRDHIVIGFGAASIDAKRKGIRFILEALNILSDILSDKNIFILFAGNSNFSWNFKYNYRSLGNINRKDLPEFYQACDLFINASLQDVGPYMLVESLMCGVPVVSFNTGFANDFVITGKTGVLVESISSNKLAKGIEHMIRLLEFNHDNIKRICRERTLNLVNIDNQIKAYMDLFRKLHD